MQHKSPKQEIKALILKRQLFERLTNKFYLNPVGASQPFRRQKFSLRIVKRRHTRAPFGQHDGHMPSPTATIQNVPPVQVAEKIKAVGIQLAETPQRHPVLVRSVRTIIAYERLSGSEGVVRFRRDETRLNHDHSFLADGAIGRRTNPG